MPQQAVARTGPQRWEAQTCHSRPARRPSIGLVHDDTQVDCLPVAPTGGSTARIAETRQMQLEALSKLPLSRQVNLNSGNILVHSQDIRTLLNKHERLGRRVNALEGLGLGNEQQLIADLATEVAAIHSEVRILDMTVATTAGQLQLDELTDEVRELGFRLALERDANMGLAEQLSRTGRPLVSKPKCDWFYRGFVSTAVVIVIVSTVAFFLL